MLNKNYEIENSLWWGLPGVAPYLHCFFSLMIPHSSSLWWFGWWARIWFLVHWPHESRAAFGSLPGTCWLSPHSLSGLSATNLEKPEFLSSTMATPGSSWSPSHRYSTSFLPSCSYSKFSVRDLGWCTGPGILFSWLVAQSPPVQWPSSPPLAHI